MSQNWTKVRLVLISPQGYAHGAVLAEVIESLQRGAGIPSFRVDDDPADGSCLAVNEAGAMEPIPTRPGQSVGFWLWKVCHEYQRLMESVLHKVGLTHLQFVMLAATDWLGKESLEVTQGQVAELTEIATAQVSHLVKALKAKGWLHQQPGRKDPRARALSLTAEGAETLARTLPQVIALESELFPQDSERQELTGHLRAVLLRWTGRLPVREDQS